MDVGCRGIGFCVWIREVFLGGRVYVRELLTWRGCGSLVVAMVRELSPIFMFKYLYLAVARQE